MIPNIAYERYAPDVIRVDSLKINVRDDIINNDPKFLTDQQSLIVGRQVYGQCNLYNLVVDHEGVMINAPLSQRTEMADQYALLVNGNMYVSGQVICGASNFEGIPYDPNGLFECISSNNIQPGQLVEVSGFSESTMIVRATVTEFSPAVFGVCSDVRSSPRYDGMWPLQVQTAGVGVIVCDGPVNIGDMLTSGQDGKCMAAHISGEIIDTAIHNYTIAKALQNVPSGQTMPIRCLFNVIKAPPLGIGGVGGVGGGGDGMWEFGSNETENIFYGGKVTVGRDYASRSNQYSFNIVSSADRTIDHSQINIENTQASQLRVGIIGTSNVSPAVINTCPGTGIEFHVGRTQNYFQKMYTERGYYDVFSQDGTSRQFEISASEVPDYTTYASPEDAPHLKIGSDGNVGIHTCANPAITYRVRNPTVNGIYPSCTESMALHVQGSTYSCNVLIWDYDSGYPKNIDDLYVRRLGKTFPANSIIPGQFALGGYSFQNNLGINGPWDSNYGLKVWGDSKFTGDVCVDGYSQLSNIMCYTSATFESDVNANADVIVAGSLLLEGGIFVSVLSNVEQDGHEQYTWQAIDFKPAGSNVTDLNHVGNGLSTPGRFGAGITSRDVLAHNALTSQLTVNKRNPNTTSNLWELELKDLSTTRYTPVGWIGHPLRLNSGNKDDASLFFATPSKTDPKYSGVYFNGIDTNIYFYPGKGSLKGVDVSQPPTLGVFSEGRVGVGTSNPKSELSVWGSITFTDQLLLYDKLTQQSFEIGLWKSGVFNTGSITGAPTFNGLQYKDVSAAHVGINVQPEDQYGVVMGSNVKVVGSYFDGNDSKLAQWYDGTDMNTVKVTQPTAPSATTSLYTWGQVGLGVNTPKSDLDIKNNYGCNTTMRLLCSDTSSETAIHMRGNNGAWKLNANDVSRRIDFGYDASNLTTDNTFAKRPLFMTWDPLLKKPQTFVGCTFDVLSSNTTSTLDKTASLIVDGGLSVIGDVNITGTYYAQGKIVFNETAATPQDLGVDDIYIGGGHVILNPDGGKSVIIGNAASGNESIDNGNLAMMRVYQSTDNPLIASFRTGTKEGMIEISSFPTGEKLRFGVLDITNAGRNNCPFAFLDKNNNPYIAFKGNAGSTSDNYVGFNTFDPKAIMHVTSTGSGSNMLLLTTTIVDQSSTSAAPELQFEKAFSSEIPPTSWTLAGPNSEYREKLTMSFKSADVPEKTEVFCFTQDGCIGIGTSRPQYALDVANTGSVGGLRLANSDANACPQILLQCGDPVFGVDGQTDHRIYSYSNNFYIDAKKNDQLIPICHVDDIGHIGLCSNATSNYDVNVHGMLNVTEAILLNGVPLFSANDTIAQASAYLRAINVYLKPNTANGGGVLVNTELDLITGNLFYMVSGENRNMMVYESIYDEAQIHMRTLQPTTDMYDMWRMGAAGTNFYFELWANCDNEVNVLDIHDFYLRAFELSVNVDHNNEFDATVQGHLRLSAPQASITLGTIETGTATISTDTSNAIYLASSSLNIVNTSTDPMSNIVNIVDAYNATVAVIDADGHIGIGTTAPRSTLDIASGQLFGENGSVTWPTYSFAANSNTGVYVDTDSSNLAITVGGVSAAIFSPGSLSVPSLTCSGQVELFAGARATLVVSSNNGYVGIGTDTPQFPLHIESNVAINGDVVPLTTSIWSLGNTDLRWNKLCLSDALDVNGTIVSNVDNGNLFVANGIETPQLSIGGININSDIQSPSGLSVMLQDSSIVFPVVTDSNSVTSMNALNLRSSNTTPFTVFTTNASDLAVFSSMSAPSALYVKGSGYVGIGTSAPWSPLTVVGGTPDPVFSVFKSTADTGMIAAFSNINGSGVYIDSNAYVGIGTQAPVSPLHVYGEGHIDGNFIAMSNMYVNNDLVVAGNTYTRYDQIVDSDKRLKTNLSNIDGALDKISQLTGYTYNYHMDMKRSTGLIAQDVLHVMPEAVGCNVKNGMYGVEYGSLMGLVVEAIKQLKSEIDDIKKKIK